MAHYNIISNPDFPFAKRFSLFIDGHFIAEDDNILVLAKLAELTMLAPKSAIMAG